MSPDAVPAEGPVVVVSRGRLREDAGAVYERYLEGTRPLMREYGVEIVAVGAGLEAEYLTECWTQNVVFRFPSRAAADGFFGDPRYRDITADRDRAYEELHLAGFMARPPRMGAAEAGR